MPPDLSPESLDHCANILSYVEDMSAWYDEDAEEISRRDYALQILHQITKRGEVAPDEGAYCEQKIKETY